MVFGPVLPSCVATRDGAAFSARELSAKSAQVWALVFVLQYCHVENVDLGKA